MGEAKRSEMAAFPLDSVTWEEIELSESFLVCSMFEEAANLASSILTRLHENENIGDEIQLRDMMTSSAMVLVQSWRESGRTSDLLNELESYFGSATGIPVQVLLTGACVQVSGGYHSGVRDFLEDFLKKWQFNSEKYHVIAPPDVQKTDVAVRDRCDTLEVEQYLEVVEFYVLTLLGGILNDVDHAILWVEKAQLPEESRQDILRRLLSLHPLETTSSLKRDVLSSVVEEPDSRPLSVKEVKQSDKPTIVLSTQCHNGVDGMKPSIWKRLHDISKRSRNAIVASNGKILLGCLIFLICYFIRKKRESIIRVVRSRALSLKRALVDFWQLAFSYQVNPLASVQPLPASANRR